MFNTTKPDQNISIEDIDKKNIDSIVNSIYLSHDKNISEEKILSEVLEALHIPNKEQLSMHHIQKSDQPIVKQQIMQPIHYKHKNNDDNIMVSYEKELHKFTFYNTNTSLLGAFTIAQLIKYLGNHWDKNFMSHIDTSISDEIIKTFICNIKIDHDIGIPCINLHSHLKSPFMGNIEMLIKINTGLHEFETTKLYNELEKISDLKMRNKIKLIVSHFIYLMLNYTLKIIAIISEEIKNDTSRQKMKETLIKYTVGITYRITNFIKDQLEIQKKQYDELIKNKNKIEKSRNILSSKIDTLMTQLSSQNNKIDFLTRHVMNKISEDSDTNSQNTTQTFSTNSQNLNTESDDLIQNYKKFSPLSSLKNLDNSINELTLSSMNGFNSDDDNTQSEKNILSYLSDSNNSDTSDIIYK